MPSSGWRRAMLNGTDSWSPSTQTRTGNRCARIPDSRICSAAWGCRNNCTEVSVDSGLDTAFSLLRSQKVLIAKYPPGHRLQLPATCNGYVRSLPDTDHRAHQWDGERPPRRRYRGSKRHDRESCDSRQAFCANGWLGQLLRSAASLGALRSKYSGGGVHAGTVRGRHCRLG